MDGDQLASVLNDNSESYQALISGERENTEGKALPEVRKTPSESSAAAKHLLLAAVPALLALVAQVVAGLQMETASKLPLSLNLSVSASVL